MTFTPPGDGQGAATNLVADIAYARKTQGRKIMLSVGGAGNGMSFPNRDKSQHFLDSVVAIYNQLGGIDGLDWNTFEGNQAPDTSEMIWISLQLKQRFPGFRHQRAAGAVELGRQGVLPGDGQRRRDGLCTPSTTTAPGLAEPAYVVPNVADGWRCWGRRTWWSAFGINPSAANYMTPANAILIWNQVARGIPAIRGGFDWEIGTDLAQGFPFAHGVGNADQAVRSQGM